MNYGLSLEERKRKLIEDCCGGMGGGDGYDLTDNSMSVDTDPTPAMEKPKDGKLNKLLRKRRNNKNGS